MVLLACAQPTALEWIRKDGISSITKLTSVFVSLGLIHQTKVMYECMCEISEVA